MTLDFGIVNYNGGTSLSDCVASILTLEGPARRVFVFDNASTDGSIADVERRFADITVIRSSRNLGYAAALNRLLREMTADVVVLCNMDLRFDPKWACVVIETLRQHPTVDSIASLVLEMTDPPVVNSAGIRLFRDLHAQNAGSGQPYRADAFSGAEVLGGYGAVMCFRRSSIHDLSFDEDYFLFFEETDFFLRFRLLGRRTLFVPEAMVHHHRSLSTRRYSPLKLYYGERNRVTTVFKLLPIWYWPITFGYSVKRFRLLGKSAPRPQERDAARFPGKAAIVWTILRAWTAAVLRLPATLRKRAAFWKTTPATPSDTIELLRHSRLPASELSLR